MRNWAHMNQMLNGSKSIHSTYIFSIHVSIFIPLVVAINIECYKSLTNVG